MFLLVYFIDYKVRNKKTETKETGGGIARGVGIREQLLRLIRCLHEEKTHAKIIASRLQRKIAVT